MNVQRSLFALSAASVVIVGFIAATIARDRVNYQETTGLVTSARIQQLPREVTQIGGLTIPQLDQATVNYIVDGQPYETTYDRPAPAYQYVLGETVPVYYDPSNPASAIIAPVDLEMGNRALLMSLSAAAVAYLLLDGSRATSKKRR